MYVYQYSAGDKLWVVGFFRPTGEWVSESDHSTKESAAKRVHYLNGGHCSCQEAE